MPGKRGLALFAFVFISACSPETLADSTFFHNTLSHDDKTHFFRTTTGGSNVDASSSSSFHGSSHQLEARQAPPGFGTLTRAFESAIWIWTAEENRVQFNAPLGDRFFRMTYTPPTGKTPVLAEMLITVDNKYSLFVNGFPVGASPNTPDSWTTAQGYQMAVPAGPILFAVRATNAPAAVVTPPPPIIDPNPVANPAGVLMAIRITHSDGTNAILASDAQWRTNILPVPGFELPTTDDSTWAAATVLARFGTGPWSTNVTIPPVLTTVTLPVPSSSLPLSSSTTSTLSSTSSILTSSTAPSSSSSPPTLVTVTETSVRDAATSAASSPSSSTKLTRPAIIGVILGGVVGGLLILMIILVFLRRRKRAAEMAAADIDTWAPTPHQSDIKPFMMENTGTSVRSASPAAWQHQHQQQGQYDYGGSNAQYGQPQAPYRYPPPSLALSSPSPASQSYADYHQPSPYAGIAGNNYQADGSWDSTAQLVPPARRNGEGVPHALTPGNSGNQGYFSTAPQSNPNPYDHGYR